MTTSKKIKKATDLLYLLASNREQEIDASVEKLLDLKKTWVQNPNRLNELRYNLALGRYERLQKDTIYLSRLEQKIEQINDDFGFFRSESA